MSLCCVNLKTVEFTVGEGASPQGANNWGRAWAARRGRPPGAAARPGPPALGPPAPPSLRCLLLSRPPRLTPCASGSGAAGWAGAPPARRGPRRPAGAGSHAWRAPFDSVDRWRRGFAPRAEGVPRRLFRCPRFRDGARRPKWGLWGLLLVIATLGIHAPFLRSRARGQESVRHAAAPAQLPPTPARRRRRRRRHRRRRRRRRHSPLPPPPTPRARPARCQTTRGTAPRPG